jgi:hypothetical protein
MAASVGPIGKTDARTSTALTELVAAALATKGGRERVTQLRGREETDVTRIWLHARRGNTTGAGRCCRSERQGGSERLS